MSLSFFIDLHCHSTLKPFGLSFPENKNSTNPKKAFSIWHSNSPGFLKKLINLFFGLTHFTQADFSTLISGNVRIIGASLYPFEKGFFVSRFGKSNAFDSAGDYITGIGKAKIEFVQNNLNYFSELCYEYEFLISLNNQWVEINGKKYSYRLINRFS
jgi:hypothetical protein